MLKAESLGYVAAGVCGVFTVGSLWFRVSRVYGNGETVCHEEVEPPP